MTGRILAAVVVCAIAVAACGGGSNKADTGGTSTSLAGGATATAAGGPTTTVDPFASTGNTLTPQGAPIGKIRVANLISDNGQPGPAIDVYDTNKPASTDAALIKDLQYGQVSDYVTPRGWATADVTSNLYVFPAGSLTPTARLNGSNIDNSGFEKDDQLTLGLATPTGSLSGFAIAQIAEAGSRVRPDAEQNPPTGRALLLVQDPASLPEDAPEHYLVIDGACPVPDGQTSSIPFALGEGTFTLAPGSHSLSMLTSPRGQGLTTCAGKTGTAKTNVVLEAGRRVDVFVYGDPKSPSIVTAAVG